MILRGGIVIAVLLSTAVVVHGFTTGPAIVHHPSKDSSRRQHHRGGGRPSTSTSTTTSRHVAPVELLDHAQAIHHAISTTTSVFWLADADASAATVEAVKEDLGWWGAYVDLFKNSLTFVHDTIEGPLRSIGVEKGIWGISIGIFTASCRTLLLPLSIQQTKSAEYMKVLKPYVKEIKAKYKGNEEAANQAVGRLYQDAKQNPLAGCAVSLATLPVFLGLYRGVRNLAMEDKLNESFLWIPSLEGPVRPPDYRGMEWLTEGWSRDPSGGLLPIPDLGWETTLAFLTMPVILVLLQSFTMQTLQPPMDEDATEEERKSMETSQTVMKFLPLMIGFFSLSVPAGLTIYWFTSNLYTLTQSVVVKAYFRANPPKIDLPDYWETALSGDAENMSPEEKRKANEAGLRVGPTFEDLIVESKFHKLIVRKPLRTTTDALAMTSTTNAEIPEELAEWVKNGPRVEVVATARV